MGKGMEGAWEGDRGGGWRGGWGGMCGASDTCLLWVAMWQ